MRVLRATHSQRTGPREPTGSVLPGPTGVTIHPVKIMDLSERQLVRVRCASVVVVCLCAVLRVTCTRLIDRNGHWIPSLLHRCMQPWHK